VGGTLWVPQWRRVALGGPDGDPYADEQNIKILWHTWEGTSWGAAESAFRPYPPHVGAKIFDEVRQYVPLDEHAYALAGSRNEGEFVIQIELAGKAHDMVGLSNDELDWIAHRVLEPILFFFPDVPDVHPPFYDDTDGFTIASPTSPIRFSFEDWKNYSGHVGHQHAPSPDAHWDPGKLNVDRIIRTARAAGNAAHKDEEDELATSIKPHFGRLKGTVHVHLVQRDYASKRYLTVHEKDGYVWINATRGGTWLESTDIIDYDAEVWAGIPYNGAKAPA
jgi:hypothetical protein